MEDLRETFSIRNLSTDRDGVSVISSFSLQVPRGSWLSIVGPNGAGKSTLLKSLAGIILCQTSGIHLGKTRLDTLEQRERACYLSYVPQRFEATLPYTVEEFLSFALYADVSNASITKVAEALALFRLEDFKCRSIQALSVGELQRVLLAAAFVQGSELLLLDEPASALDPYEELQMIKVLSILKEKAKRTVIFVTHNLSSALSFADNVLVLTEGKERFLGTPSELVGTRVLQEVFQQDFLISQAQGQISVVQKYA